jgi:hypothetical protein
VTAEYPVTADYLVTAERVLVDNGVLVVLFKINRALVVVRICDAILAFKCTIARGTFRAQLPLCFFKCSLI